MWCDKWCVAVAHQCLQHRVVFITDSIGVLALQNFNLIKFCKVDLEYAQRPEAKRPLVCVTDIAIGFNWKFSGNRWAESNSLRMESVSLAVQEQGFSGLCPERLERR